MNCSVNLVPTARRQARVRLARRNAWFTAGGAALLVASLAWLLQQTAAGAYGRLREDCQALEVQRADVDRLLVMAGAERDRLFDELRTVSGARRPQPWPSRLLKLTESTPKDVFFTALNIVTPRDFSQGRGARGAGADAPLVGDRSQTLKITGYALDHNALIQLLSTLQSLPDFGRVELVRATSEEVRGGTWVEFEIMCFTQEGRS
jgi:hypothetical protein